MNIASFISTLSGVNLLNFNPLNSSNILINELYIFNLEILPRIWYDEVSYKIEKTDRRKVILNWKGFKYRKEANYQSNIHWVCCNEECRARCITNSANYIKFSSVGHNHSVSNHTP